MSIAPLTYLTSKNHFPWQVTALQYIKNEVCDVLLLSGGFGSGKTAVNAHNVWQIAKEGNKKGIVIAPTYSLLRDTICQTMEEEIPEKHCKLTLKGSPFRWSFQKCNSELLSRSMRYEHEAGVRLKSINADFLWLVEATELPKKAFTYGISRLRRGGEGARHPVIIETNPSSRSNWVYETFLKGSKEIYKSDDKNWWVTKKITEYEDDNGNMKEIVVLAIHATTYANTAFPRSIIKQMEDSYSPSEAQRLLYGIWNAKESRTWEYYKIFEVKGDPKEYAKKYDDVIVGVDPAQTNPTAIVLIGFADGVYEVFDEYIEVNKSVRSCLSQLERRMETWGLTDRSPQVWVDPSEKHWVREWNEIPSQKYFAYQSKHRGTDPAYNRAVKLGEWLRTERLIINKLCKGVIKDIEQTTYKINPVTGKETVDKEEHDPHAMDAVGYVAQKRG